MSSLTLRRLSNLSVAVFVLLSASATLLPAVTLAQDADESPEERAKVRVFEALDLMDATSYGEARLMLQLALGLNASLDRAWYYLAQCNVELGNWDEALRALTHYEVAEISEHERLQIVDLRKKIQSAKTVDSGNESDGTVATAPSEPDSAADPAAAAGAPSESSPAAAGAGATGSVLIVIGGIVTGVGAALWARGGVLSASNNNALYSSGRGPWFAGIGMVAAGSISLAIGIPLTVKGKNKSAQVAFSLQPVAVKPSAAVYLVGQW